MVTEQELAELKAIEERLRTEVEGPSRAGLVHRSLLLGGSEGALLARYERMHDTAFHRAYKALLKGEVQHEDEVAPTPVTPAHLAGTAAVLDITAAKTGAPNEATEAVAAAVGVGQKEPKSAAPGWFEPVVAAPEGVLSVAPAVAAADPPGLLGS